MVDIAFVVAGTIDSLEVGMAAANSAGSDWGDFVDNGHSIVDVHMP